MSWSSTISPSFTCSTTAASMAITSEVAQSRGSTDQPSTASPLARATWITPSEQQPPGGRTKTARHPAGSRAWVSMISLAIWVRVMVFIFPWL